MVKGSEKQGDGSGTSARPGGRGGVGPCVTIPICQLFARSVCTATRVICRIRIQLEGSEREWERSGRYKAPGMLHRVQPPRNSRPGSSEQLS